MGFGRKDMTGSADSFDDFAGTVVQARFGTYQFGQGGRIGKGLVITFRMSSGQETKELYGPGSKQEAAFTPSADGLSFEGAVGRKSKIDKLVGALEALGIEIKGDDPRELEGINAHWERQVINLGKDDKGEKVEMKVLLPTKLLAAFKSREEASAELTDAVVSVVAEVLKANGPITKGALIGKIFPRLPEAIRQKGAELATEESFLAAEGRPWSYSNSTLTAV